MDVELACCDMGYRPCVFTKDQWFQFLREFECIRWIVKEERLRELREYDSNVKEERLPVL